MDRRPVADTELLLLVERLFRPAVPHPSPDAPPRVGLEVELFVFDPAAPRPGPIAIDRVQAALATDPGLAAAARVSFEPGGQLELSPSPRASVVALVSDVDGLLGRIRAALARDGLAVAVAGVDPWRSADELGLQLETDRYMVMQHHFDAIGPAGRRMMRQTASLQVCIDLLPGRAGRRQWLAANVVGPALAAAFRNPPTPDNRTAIWLDVDPSRTGFDGAQLDDRSPAEAYTAFALRAEAMPLPRQDDDTPLPFRRPFRDWTASPGTRPDTADVAHHLTTLFPPVRPRGYLEIRYLDAQDPAGIGAAVALIAVLCADMQARECAIEIAGDVPRLGEFWRRSADVGLADRALRGQAVDMVEMAAVRASAVARRWPGWLPADTEATLLALAGALRVTLDGGPS